MRSWVPKTGEWVEVRSVPEILDTLDDSGDLDKLPFMREMLKFAGQRFQVESVAHKTCDTVNRTGGRRLRRAVHLSNLRCDGAAHGGCQARCLLFWKAAWLRPARALQPTLKESRGSSHASLLDHKLTRNAAAFEADGTPVYRCQATRLYEATETLAWWSPMQYITDVTTRNRSLSNVASTLILAAVYNLRRFPIGYRVSCKLYDWFHRLLRRRPDPHPHGTIPVGFSTPDERLDLKPGELVEIKSKSEIERTLNTRRRNRGLSIDEEMAISCGERRHVIARIERIINEQTGRMMHFQNPCIALEGLYCEGRYSRRRLLCPRRIVTYWREIWLRRVDTETEPPSSVHTLPSAD
jgi:hypothetical protein